LLLSILKILVSDAFGLNMIRFHFVMFFPLVLFSWIINI